MLLALTASLAMAQTVINDDLEVQGQLQVDGDITTDGDIVAVGDISGDAIEGVAITYTGPRGRFLSLSPHNFVFDEVSGVLQSTGGSVNVTGGSLRAGVQMPDNAAIQEVTCWVEDSSSTRDISVFMRRTTKTPTAVAGVAAGVSLPISFNRTAGTPGVTNLTTVWSIPPAENIVDNINFGYHIQYNPDNGCTSAECRLTGCTVFFTVERPD